MLNISTILPLLAPPLPSVLDLSEEHSDLQSRNNSAHCPDPANNDDDS